MVRMSVLAKKSPTRVIICCRKRDPFQGPKLGSCLTLGNELSEETHVLTKGTWSGCPIRGQKMISRTLCTVPKSEVPSEGQPTWKVGHSALQKVINLFFFTSTDRFCALDLKSEKWSVLRDNGVEVSCPMITG